MSNRNILFMKKLTMRSTLVELYMNRIAKEITMRGPRHDSSKRSGVERATFMKYHLKPVDIWGISNKSHPHPDDLQAAIVIHAKNNDYRPEHHPNGMRDMNICQLTEMICDIATSAKELGILDENRRTTCIKSMLRDRYDVEEPLSSIITNSVNKLISKDSDN